MNSIKVALLQLMPEENLQGNIEKGTQAIEKSAMIGADIALFPEMWSCGYDFPQDENALRELAVSKDSSYTEAFRKAAVDNDIAVAVTYLAKNGSNSPFNAVTLFDRYGAEKFTYYKVHTLAMKECCHTEMSFSRLSLTQRAGK
jgi:predicted amidohydrolase